MRLLISAAFGSGPTFQVLGFRTTAPQSFPGLPGCLENPGPWGREAPWRRLAHGITESYSPSPREINHDWRSWLTLRRLGRRRLRGLHMKGPQITQLESMEADVSTSIAAP
ncbi:unnamed protein product [Spirodela intermedia]|uniref:Uncharacterized protein n=1 Tax=Spirodela intermedia TaxID=51605 RepID=A0A7I8KYU6_SPIIN|nr:unnamed protein product [Spirodela intermedia]